MKQEQLKSAYEQFFYKTPEGEHFMEAIDLIIEQSHKYAEDDAQSARDYVQRAKGAREVLNHIQSITTDVKKGKYSK